jgi:hypothetical protein
VILSIILRVSLKVNGFIKKLRGVFEEDSLCHYSHVRRTIHEKELVSFK